MSKRLVGFVCAGEVHWHVCGGQARQHRAVDPAGQGRTDSSRVYRSRHAQLPVELVVTQKQLGGVLGGSSTVRVLARAQAFVGDALDHVLVGREQGRARTGDGRQSAGQPASRQDRLLLSLALQLGVDACLKIVHLNHRQGRHHFPRCRIGQVRDDPQGWREFSGTLQFRHDLPEILHPVLLLQRSHQQPGIFRATRLRDAPCQVIDGSGRQNAWALNA